MAYSQYNGTSAAAGNPTNVHAVAELLKPANAVTCIDNYVKTIPVPKNKNETVNLQRAVTPDPSTTEVGEGVNPTPRALTYENVTKTFEEFAEAFAVSSRQAELGEYDVLMDSKDRLIDLIRRTREKNAWLEYYACNNGIYNSSAHTNRNQINGALSMGRLKVAARLLMANRASYITKATKGALQQGTVPMQAAFVVLAHTDCRADIENLPGYRPRPEIGGAENGIPEWIGNAAEFAFVLSPEFEPRLAAGAAIGSTGMRSVAGVNVDVYTHLVFGAEALGKCSLKGMASAKGLGGLMLEVLDKADKSDITNQRRYVSARWWDAPVILNQNWVVAVETGVTANPT